jgi:HAE1 family hydrophobic/amphiphilic exporter-1
VVYVYLDKLSNIMSGWGRSKRDNDNRSDKQMVAKQAAE